jgi:CRP-like cAMP-binding protein
VNADAEELKRFAVFAECSEEDRRAIAELPEERVLRAGSPLFREGGEASGLVLVAEGALRIESRRAGRLGVLGAGGAIGGVALVAAGPREVSAVAEAKTRVWVLERTAFRRLVLDSPHAACRVAEGVLAQFAVAVRSQLDRFASES